MNRIELFTSKASQKFDFSDQILTKLRRCHQIVIQFTTFSLIFFLLFSLSMFILIVLQKKIERGGLVLLFCWFFVFQCPADPAGLIIQCQLCIIYCSFFQIQTGPPLSPSYTNFPYLLHSYSFIILPFFTFKYSTHSSASSKSKTKNH